MSILVHDGGEPNPFESAYSGVVKANPTGINQYTAHTAHVAHTTHQANVAAGAAAAHSKHEAHMAHLAHEAHVRHMAMKHGEGSKEHKAAQAKKPKKPKTVTKAAMTPPQGVQDAAARALQWIADGKAGDGFTSVGKIRAQQLAAGETISADTVQRMSSYFARHAVDGQADGFNAGDPGYPSPGRVAWDAWGGDAGRAWVKTLTQ